MLIIDNYATFYVIFMYNSLYLVNFCVIDGR